MRWTINKVLSSLCLLALLVSACNTTTPAATTSAGNSGAIAATPAVTADTTTTQVAGATAVLDPGSPAAVRAGQNLTPLVMQPGDLPAEYSVYSTGKTEAAFPDTPEAHDQLVNSRVVVLKTNDNKHVYSNGILVFADVDHAKKAYLGIIQGNRPNTVVPLGINLGDETYAMQDLVTNDSLPRGVSIGMVLWRDHETVMYVSAADAAKRISIGQMQSLAQKLYDRFLGKS
jgi:hypothetical protein